MSRRSKSAMTAQAEHETQSEAPQSAAQLQAIENAARAVDELAPGMAEAGGENASGAGSGHEFDAGESYDDAARDIVTTAIEIACLVDGPHWKAPADQAEQVARALARVLAKYDQTWSAYAPEIALAVAVGTFAFPRVLESLRLRKAARAQAKINATGEQAG